MPLTKAADAQAALLALAERVAKLERRFLSRVETLERAHNEIAAFLNSEDDDGLAALLGSRTGRLHQRCDELQAQLDRLQAPRSADKPSGGTKSQAKPRIRVRAVSGRLQASSGRSERQRCASQAPGR